MLITHDTTALNCITQDTEKLGAKVERLGHWLWASFTSKPEQAKIDAMKAAGYHWSASKHRWYMIGAVSNSPRHWSYKEIKQKYGAPQDTTEAPSWMIEG